MNLTSILSIVLALIFLTLGSIHFYWAVGGQWGINNALPQNEEREKVLRPSFLPIIIVGLGLCFFGIFYLVEMKWLSVHLPNWLVQIIGWIIPTIFLLRTMGDFKYVGLFKKIKHTDFAKWDTQLYIPLCFLIGITGILVAIF